MYKLFLVDFFFLLNTLEKNCFAQTLLTVSRNKHCIFLSVFTDGELNLYGSEPNSLNK